MKESEAVLASEDTSNDVLVYQSWVNSKAF